MTNLSYLPRILFITPHILFSPKDGFSLDNFFTTQEGKETDGFSFLLSDLYHLGADIHVVQPEYRKVFSFGADHDGKSVCNNLPGNNVHLAKDRIFYYTNDIDANCDWENIRISLAFQREVIQYFISMIQPDLIHCYGWMTGLIPAASKMFGIPCLFTIHDLKTQKIPLWCIEDMGIDAAIFWDKLFYDRMPAYYEETRESNLVDLLLSGIHSATQIDVASSDVLTETVRFLNSHPKTSLGNLLSKKCAHQGISSICSNTISTQAYLDIYEHLLQRSVVDYSFDMDIKEKYTFPFTVLSGKPVVKTEQEISIY